MPDGSRCDSRPARSAHAHCDIPCGVYDPEQARIEAESCYRIIEKYHASEDEVFRARCIIVKEERAELTKHHIDVMWHDYFKPEHVEKYPDLHDVCWKASKQASQVKRTSTSPRPRSCSTSSTRSTRCGRARGGPAKTRLAPLADRPVRTSATGRADARARLAPGRAIE